MRRLTHACAHGQAGQASDDAAEWKSGAGASLELGGGDADAASAWQLYLKDICRIQLQVLSLARHAGASTSTTRLGPSAPRRSNASAPS